MQTLYKFLRTGLKSEYGDHKWEIGKWYEVKGGLQECANGFHASVEPLDALRYVPGEIVAIVECDGDHILSSDRQVWRKMRVVDARVWSKRDSVALAIFSARSVLDLFEAKYPSDNRPRKAIQTAEVFLDSATGHTVAGHTDAAAAAAYAAADAAAAYAAAAAADAAAADAAAYAAYGAARAAAAAAYAAADAAYDAACAARGAAYDASAAAAARLELFNEWIKYRFASLEKSSLTGSRD